MPIMLAAWLYTSSSDPAIFTPPPFPLPPACICALIAQVSVPVRALIFSAASLAAAGVSAIIHSGTGTLNFLRIAFA